MRMIPTTVHAVLDYIIGLALILAPNIFGFAELGGAAVVLPRVLGIAILLMALITRWELGVIKALPVPAHLAVDYVAGLLLAASPWIFGFYDEPANAWAPHLVVGLLIFGQALLTQSEARLSERDDARTVTH